MAVNGESEEEIITVYIASCKPNSRIIDSRCSAHMTGTIDNLSHVEPDETNIQKLLITTPLCLGKKQILMFADSEWTGMSLRQEKRPWFLQ